MGKIKRLERIENKFIKNQFDIFSEKTGVHFDKNLYEEFLDAVFDKTDALYFVNKDEFSGQINTGFILEAVLSEKANNMILPTITDQKKNLSDKEFEKTINAYIDLINNINMTIRTKNGSKNIHQQISGENKLGNLNTNEYNNLYEQMTGKSKIVEQQYQKEVFALKEGKSDKLVNDMQKSLDDRDYEKASAVYRTLKEKQKRNSIWTNWFTRKGYQERRAIKNAKEVMIKRLNLDNEQELNEYTQRHANTNVSTCNKFEDRLKEEATKSSKYPIVDKFYEFKQSMDVDAWCQKQIDDLKVLKSEKGANIKVDVQANEFDITNSRPSFESNQPQKDIDLEK